MNQLLSPALVKQSLSGHSWLGIAMGAMLYLVCLSGSVAVFYPEFEQWEQPHISPVPAADGTLVQTAYEALVAETAHDEEDEEAAEEEHDDHHHHRYVILPTADSPYLAVADDTQGWFSNADGSLGEQTAHPWTHLLINLHLYLHLPMSFGMIVVSILGVMLTGLIISGFLSHPRIFKDAFTWRTQAAPRLQQADIHNRLSVWGAPFYLTIAITGSFFGLANLFGFIAANAYFDGDTSKVIPAIYGEEPHLEQPLQIAQVGKALDQMHDIAPQAEPLYMTIEGIDTTEQFILVGATHPGRLIYVEQYRFDSAGNYLDKIGFSDGEAGRQAIFSVYRLHFGHYGGTWVQVVYVLLGLALTVICASGINIWLAKRNRRDALNNIWTGIVWGAPAALAATAAVSIGAGLTAPWVFWCTLIAAMILAQITDNHPVSKYRMQLVGAALLVMTVIAHAVKFGGAAFNTIALPINLTLTAVAIILVVLAWRGRQSIAQSTPEDLS